MTATHAESSVWIPEPGTYVVDPAGSSIEFRTKHMWGLGTVTGTFEVTSGSIKVANPPDRSTVKAAIDAGSFSTGNARRDKDARSARFLDVNRWPTITFASTKVGRIDSAWTIEGTVTVGAKAAPVTLTITESQPRDGGLDMVAQTRIDRYAHGITAMKGMAARHLDLTIRLKARAA